jgi:hypothetical protein
LLLSESDFTNILGKGAKAKEFGLNFGAPGDRLAADGTLWIDYPSVGGDKINVPVKISGGKAETGFTSGIKASLPWVASSALIDVEKIEIETDKGDVELSLYFCKTNSKDEFSVAVNGKTVIAKMPEPGLELVKTVMVKSAGKLTVTFKKSAGRTFINGLKVKIK